MVRIGRCVQQHACCAVQLTWSVVRLSTDRAATDPRAVPSVSASAAYHAVRSHLAPVAAAAARALSVGAERRVLERSADGRGVAMVRVVAAAVIHVISIL